MSEGSTQDGSEQLFDTNTDDTEDSQNNTDADSQENGDGEENADSLDIKDKASERETNRQHQIDVWGARLAKGEVLLSEIPANLQWLKKEIAHLEPKGDTVALDKELVRQVLQEEKELQEFEALKASVGEIKLTVSQKQAIQQEFNLRRSKLGDLLALKDALRLADVDLTSDRRSRMSIPTMGMGQSMTSKRVKAGDWESLQGVRTLSPQERSKAYLELLK